MESIMLEPRRFTTVAFASLLGWAGCQGQLFTLAVEESAVTTVPAATPLEVLIGDVGLGEFVAFDITQATELQNQGVGPGDIMNVSFTLFELEVLTGSTDLSFLDSMEVYVESDGLPRQLVASAPAFPAGQAVVAFDLEPVDLTDYAVSQSMTFTTEVTGSRPEADTEIEARFALDVGVTGQGACNYLENQNQPEEG